MVFALQDTLYYLPAEAHALGWQQQGLADRLYAKASRSTSAPAPNKPRQPLHCRIDQAVPTCDTLRELHNRQERQQHAESAQHNQPTGSGSIAAPAADCSPSAQATGTSMHTQRDGSAVAQPSNVDSSNSRVSQNCSPSVQTADTPRHIQPDGSVAAQSSSADSSHGGGSQDCSSDVCVEQQDLDLPQERSFQLPEPFVQRPRIGSRLFVQSHFPGIAAALAAEMVSWQTDMRIRQAPDIRLICCALLL